jgi:predicted aspartyl protease
MAGRQHRIEAIAMIAKAPMLWFAMLLTGISPALADPPQCQLKRMVVLDMQTGRRGDVSVPVTIENHPARLMIDTGGAYSTVDASFAQFAGLKEWQTHGVDITMSGGIPLNYYTMADSFQLGPVPGKDIRFLVVPTSVSVGESMGTLGADVMSGFDIDLDFAGSKFSVFSPDHCPGKVVYWTTGAYASVPIALDRGNHISVSIMLDGKPLKAILDTGASRSFMNFRAAREIFGIVENNPQLKATGSRNMNGVVPLESFRYPFSSITFEGIEIRNPDIEIIKYPDSDNIESDLILGIGVLRQLHMYIAYGEKMLYLTPAEAH